MSFRHECHSPLPKSVNSLLILYTLARVEIEQHRHYLLRAIVRVLCNEHELSSCDVVFQIALEVTEKAL